MAFAVERSKKAGNDAFVSGHHREAVRLYTQAIAGDPTDKALFSNRSAASLALGHHDDALADAAACVSLARPTVYSPSTTTTTTTTTTTM